MDTRIADPASQAGTHQAKPKSDIEIARGATLKPIEEIGAGLGIPEKALYRYGPHVAKLSLDYIHGLADREDGRLILVTAITPTPAGEGKTTTTVGLGDGLNRIGRKTAICLREPSLGPCFGMKGGAAGGGYSQVVPMETINLHFTGDFHAIGSAHNLLAALIDNHIYWGNDLNIDARRITWRRVMDMNDRALRSIVSSLGGTANGFPREDGFDITVASEIMAIFCLATDLQDLQRRLGDIVVAYTRDRKPVTARDLKAEGPMTALLRDAMMPNLVQTLENSPAFVHGGPFANIAHGCNSVMATRTALKLADFVVTEAGFGADLGAEKFFDIKVPQGRAETRCRGDRRHRPRPQDARRRGQGRSRHGERRGGRGGAREPGPAPAQPRPVRRARRGRHQPLHRRHRGGGRGGPGLLRRVWGRLLRQQPTGPTAAREFEAMAARVAELAEQGSAQFRTLYRDEQTLWDKMRTIARTIYGADDIIADKKVRDQFAQYQSDGYGHFPICVAKTQYSFSTDPNLKGAPSNHVVPIREVRLAGGAEFLVVICGEIMTMPGLPRVRGRQFDLRRRRWPYRGGCSEMAHRRSFRPDAPPTGGDGTAAWPRMALVVDNTAPVAAAPPEAEPSAIRTGLPPEIARLMAVHGAPVYRALGLAPRPAAVTPDRSEDWWWDWAEDGR